MTSTPGVQRNHVTIAICYAAGLIDGFDLIMNALIARQLMAEFGMSAGQMGHLFGLTSFGLLLGALVGGWAVDRFGPKESLIASLIIFGSASCLSSMASSISEIMVTRAITGLGIGALFPTLIAVIALLSPPDKASRRATAMVSAITIGSSFAAILLMIVPGFAWRHLLLIGGLLPLALAPIALFTMERFSSAPAPQAPSLLALLREGRAGTTLLLWLAIFAIGMVTYILLNWLPALLGSMRYADGSIAFVMLSFTLASSLGVLAFAALMKPSRMRAVVMWGYTGAAIGILAIVTAGEDLMLMLLAVSIQGFFQTGLQCLLYGLSPTFYPDWLRGSGAGAAVGAGRIGSIVGPVAIGVLLDLGFSGQALLTTTIPVLLLSLGATLWLLRRPAAATPGEPSG